MIIKTWQERPKINSVYGNNSLMQDEIDDLRTAIAKDAARAVINTTPTGTKGE